MINKIPDAAALKLRIFLKDIHVILQSAAAIAHGVAVFHHDKRAVQRVEVTFSECREVVDAGVHQPDVVGVGAIDGAFADDGTSVVSKLHADVAHVGAYAAAAFVAYRPNDDRRMVLVAFKQAGVC